MITMRYVTHIIIGSVFLIILFSGVVDAQSQATLKNPLDPSLSNIPAFIAGFLRAVVLVSLPIITLFIVLSGFMFVTARGNQAKLTLAKKNFFAVLIGAILILGAWVLATLIGGTVTQLVGGN